ncbi:hypothetical protein X801_09849 [Opisthorchis viverrini]|uniref:Uncharacterized protein n=1 Tax=Opisthorchis viverrini TaxID=6198 RepID=A0A1S8WIS6_OPIVI|nr:hypothetical protein X801_09849 [Opisthorchis viverrini]
MLCAGANVKQLHGQMKENKYGQRDIRVKSHMG